MYRTTHILAIWIVLIVPMFAPYNQILLVPAILALIRSSTSGMPILPAIRLARIIGGLLLIWPWITTLLLCAVYVCLRGLPPELRHRILYLPLYSNFMVPIFVCGLALADVWLNPMSGLRDSATAE